MILNINILNAIMYVWYVKKSYKIHKKNAKNKIKYAR